MSLHEESHARRHKAKQMLGEKVRILDREIEALSRSRIVERSARVGQVAPEFTLPDAHGSKVSLSNLLQRGPVFKLDLADRNGEETWELPVSGTFVIDTQRIIRFAHVEPNFMTGRAEPEAVLEVLREVQLCVSQ